MKPQPQYIFTINRNKRHQVQIENITTDSVGQLSDGVFFTKEYLHAINILNSIIDIQTNNKEKNCYGQQNEHGDCCLKNKNLGRNNIILFTGQRGSGKTSAILSLGQYLEKNEIKQKKFKCLPLIDPSYFDNNNNILKSVLATMFRIAKCMPNCSNEKEEQSTLNVLWRCFDNVYKIIGDIEGRGRQDYSLETLNELGESSDLQKAMQKLINEFIKVSPCQYDFLVLLIDDLDMNVSFAAQMLEQIRKFLMLDNLVILMAANLDQLQNEMREAYSSSFQHTINDKNHTLAVDVEDLATRYLLKVFPASRRIHLNNATNNLVKTKVQIIDSSNKYANEDDKYKKYNGEKLQQVVLTLIWERTRLLFIPKNENLLHPIIPTNLRDLSQFINFLLDMDTIECDAEHGKLFKDADNYYLCQQNFERFKNYIINNWIPENLSYEEEMLFNNIPHDVSEINKHLINAINVIGTKNKKRLMSREVDLEQIVRYADGVNIDRDIYTMVSPNDPRFVKANKISDIFNQPSNYSYGDLLLMIDKYETYFESEEDRRFINAVKIYYTMLLFETMFFKSTDVKYCEEDMKDMGVDTIIPIQRLLGGTVYYPNYFEIITSAHFKQKGPSFDAKRAFYHKFTFIYEIQEAEKTNDYERKTKALSAIKQKQIDLLFFILYYGDVRPDRYDQKHTYDTTHYDDALIDGIKYATFDILSLLNNVLNPLQTAIRANDVIRIKKDLLNPDSISVEAIEMRKKLFDKTTRWKEVCSIDSNCNIPNSILPFYFVDAMMEYLRKSYDDSEIIGRSEKNRMDLFNKERGKSIYQILEFDKYYKDGVFHVNQLIDTLQDSGYEIKLHVKSLIDSNSKLLIDSKKQYEAIIHEANNGNINVMTERYKNDVIEKLLEQIELRGEKETNDIIKKIKECQLIIDIYHCLKKVLWKDMLMESVIKQDIQQKIRSRSSIHNYYNKLWDLTKQAFDKTCAFENNKNSELESVYYSIYRKGVEIFIDPV